MRRSLTILAAAGAVALAAVAAPSNADARVYGYGAYHHHYYGHHGWRAFRGSACDFRNFGRDRQLHGTC